jgi:beta-carotene 3-hydroxylase
MNPTLSHALIWFPVASLIAVGMELWAALLHGRVWHTWLWRVHRSHHEPRVGRWELNDALALFHAPIAIALILWGCASEPRALREIAFGVGVGMTAFALGYLVVHDGLVHGRLPVQFLNRFKVMRRISRAHRVHHTVASGGRPYGLFFGAWELARASRLKQQHARRPSSGRPRGPIAPPA